MKIRIYIDEIQVAKRGSPIYYALPLKPKLGEVVECAGTVGLDHRELGLLADIVVSKDPLAKAEALGVDALLGIRK